MSVSIKNIMEGRKRLALLNSARSQATNDPMLTSYAQGLTQKVSLEDVEFIAPTVRVPATIGRYNTFDDSNHFQVYNTERALNGKRTRITFGKSTATYDARPQALEVGIDDQEWDAAGDDAQAQRLLKEGKISSLVSSTYNSEFNDVMTTLNAAVSAVGGVGVWGNDSNDPIDEINAQILAIANNTGMMPNRILMSLGAFSRFVGNQKVQDRVKGGGLASADFNQYRTALLNPNMEFRVATWIKDLAKRKGTRTTQNLVGDDCWIFVANPNPSVYDPTFAKTFRGGNKSIGNVLTYREESESTDWYYVNWSRVVKVASSLCVKRITTADS